MLVLQLPVDAVLQALSQVAAERPNETIGAIVAVVATLFNYQRTGNLPIGRLPWHYFRRLLRDLGDKYFGVNRPRGVPGVVVDEIPSRIARRLRERNYESIDLYSYEYTDEAFGLRRPSGLEPHPGSGEPAPMETHPRGFRTDDDRTLIITHDEASRLERPGDHLAETMLSWHRGRDTITNDLEALGYDFELVESEAAANITVVSP